MPSYRYRSIADNLGYCLFIKYSRAKPDFHFHIGYCRIYIDDPGRYDDWAPLFCNKCAIIRWLYFCWPRRVVPACSPRCIILSSMASRRSNCNTASLPHRAMPTSWRSLAAFFMHYYDAMIIYLWGLISSVFELYLSWLIVISPINHALS